jgi:hypothetical protein
VFQHFKVNPLKDVKINIFAININGKVGFRVIIRDPIRPGGKDTINSEDYIIYDASSISELVDLAFLRYVGVSRGSKHIFATINIEPPGRLQFIQEKNQLAECYSLSSQEVQDLIQKIKGIFNIK